MRDFIQDTSIECERKCEWDRKAKWNSAEINVFFLFFWNAITWMCHVSVHQCLMFGLFAYYDKIIKKTEQKRKENRVTRTEAAAIGWLHKMILRLHCVCVCVSTSFCALFIFFDSRRENAAIFGMIVHSMCSFTHILNVWHANWNFDRFEINRPSIYRIVLLCFVQCACVCACIAHVHLLYGIHRARIYISIGAQFNLPAPLIFHRMTVFFFFSS